MKWTIWRNDALFNLFTSNFCHKFHDLDETNVNKYLKEKSSETSFGVKGIVLDSSIKSELLTNMQNRGMDFEIIDPSTGQEMSASKFNKGWFGTNYNLSMSGSEGDKNINQYLKDNNLKLEDVIDIQRMNNPVAGYGTTATV